MKSLAEHNETRFAAYLDMNNPRPNGIACPKCGEELNDTTPFLTLTSNPPQTNVGCKCGYYGTRIV